MSDETNAKYLFSTTHTELLTAIANDEIDAKLMAEIELANRGLNARGEWVGFEEAKEEFNLIEKVIDQKVSNLLGYFKKLDAELCERLHAGEFNELVKNFDSFNTEELAELISRNN